MKALLKHKKGIALFLIAVLVLPVILSVTTTKAFASGMAAEGATHTISTNGREYKINTMTGVYVKEADAKASGEDYATVLYSDGSHPAFPVYYTQITADSNAAWKRVVKSVAETLKLKQDDLEGNRKYLDHAVIQYKSGGSAKTVTVYGYDKDGKKRTDSNESARKTKTDGKAYLYRGNGIPYLSGITGGLFADADFQAVIKSGNFPSVSSVAEDPETGGSVAVDQAEDVTGDQNNLSLEDVLGKVFLWIFGLFKNFNNGMIKMLLNSMLSKFTVDPEGTFYLLLGSNSNLIGIFAIIGGAILAVSAFISLYACFFRDTATDTPWAVLARTAVGAVLIVLSKTILTLVNNLFFGGGVLGNSKGIAGLLNTATSAEIAAIEIEEVFDPSTWNNAEVSSYFDGSSTADLAMDLLSIILTLAVIIQLVRVFLEVMERWILINVFYIISPMVAGFTPAKSTSQAPLRLFMDYINSCLLLCMNFWFISIFTRIMFNMSQNNDTYVAFKSASSWTGVSVALLLIGILQVCTRMDNYFNDIGLSVSAIGANMFGMVAAGAGVMMQGVGIGTRAAKSAGRAAGAGVEHASNTVGRWKDTAKATGSDKWLSGKNISVSNADKKLGKLNNISDKDLKAYESALGRKATVADLARAGANGKLNGEATKKILNNSAHERLKTRDMQLLDNSNLRMKNGQVEGRATIKNSNGSFSEGTLSSKKTEGAINIANKGETPIYFKPDKGTTRLGGDMGDGLLPRGGAFEKRASNSDDKKVMLDNKELQNFNDYRKQNKGQLDDKTLEEIGTATGRKEQIREAMKNDNLYVSSSGKGELSLGTFDENNKYVPLAHLSQDENMPGAKALKNENGEAITDGFNQLYGYGDAKSSAQGDLIKSTDDNKGVAAFVASQAFDREGISTKGMTPEKMSEYVRQTDDGGFDIRLPGRSYVLHEQPLSGQIELPKGQTVETFNIPALDSSGVGTNIEPQSFAETRISKGAVENVNAPADVWSDNGSQPPAPTVTSNAASQPPSESANNTGSNTPRPEKNISDEMIDQGANIER